MLDPSLLFVLASLALLGAITGLGLAGMAHRAAPGVFADLLLGALGGMALGFPAVRYMLSFVLDGAGPPAWLDGAGGWLLPLVMSLAGATLAVAVGRRLTGQRT